MIRENDKLFAPSGEMRMRHLLDTRIGEYNAMIPMVDIDTIGAGGGSIAYVDEGGIFRVGPKSAGADPGPACYNQGGDLPTSTDAHVLLGRITSATTACKGLSPIREERCQAHKKPLFSRVDPNLSNCYHTHGAAALVSPQLKGSYIL